MVQEIGFGTDIDLQPVPKMTVAQKMAARRNVSGILIVQSSVIWFHTLSIMPSIAVRLVA
jgi:hypothetical protein